MTGLLAAVRAIHLGSLMTIFGASAFALMLERSHLPRPWVNSRHALFVIAATLSLISGIVWFCAIAGEMSGGWQGSFDPDTLALAAFQTRFGHVFVGRLVALGALFLITIVPARIAKNAIPVLAGLLLASLAPIGHAGASGSSMAIFGAANGAVHLLTAGFWLGGLVLLAFLIAAQRSDPPSLVAPLRLFSTWGTLVVAFLVLSGVINSAMILPGSALTFHNGYFDLLLAKIGLAAAMIILAAFNRWKLVPSLEQQRGTATRQLARSVAAEILFGSLIVLIVGFLGAMDPH